MGECQDFLIGLTISGALRGCPPLEGVASNEVRVRGRLSPPLLINDKTDAEKVRHDIKNRSLIDETDRH